ncbi:MAG: DUF1549 domain-containing protein, partial [Planctomycetales bacterium]|nr:DUF1549 domain-containing protein [Planctomycetales bacterium]
MRRPFIPRRIPPAAFLITLTLSGSACADAVSYTQQVQPILAKRCFACHGPDVAESGLALDQREAALGQADSGASAIVPHKPGESEVIRRITTTEVGDRMPPEGGPLPSSEVEILRSWIEAGAPYEKHWAFVAPRPRDPPEVSFPEWAANPIDRFILARLLDKGLAPSPPADRRALARRVYFDVTGLPPTTAELNEFLADDRADAYPRLVDKLLASPRYGEKWGRHLLDVVRYAESN